ncbi:MAG: FtsQ-type POTRA domain-containing protein [Dehalococcoidia bacterium]
MTTPRDPGAGEMGAREMGVIGPRRTTTRAQSGRGKPVRMPATTGGRFSLGAAPAPRTSTFERASKRMPSWRRLGLGIAGLLGIVIVATGVQWVVFGGGFRVEEVRLEGVEAADPLAIAAAADLTGQSLLTLNAEAVAARVAEVPGVQAVEVHRDWPRSVVVEVTEHQGFAYWELDGETLVVNADGQVISVGRAPVEGAPTIVETAAVASADAANGTDGAASNLEGAGGASAKAGAPPLDEGAEDELPDADTVRVVARLVEGDAFAVLRVRPRGFVFEPERGLVIEVDGGPNVVFGDSHDFDFKVATWGALLDEIEGSGLQPREIDLRFGRHVVMR